MRQHTIHTPYLIGEVHCYSTEINGELVLFDSGPPTAEAFATLQSQLDISRLKYLFITHCHIDHFGLATMIAEHSDARIFIPRAEASMLRRSAERLDRLVSLLTGLGCAESMARFIREKMERDERSTVMHDRFEILEESDTPEKLGIDWIACPGHSQSDLIYIHGGDAVTGDTLLRNIFQVPILDVDAENFDCRFRNYDAYCENIRSLRRLRGIRIHPGHRWHVDGVDATILFYANKLLERAGQLREVAPDASIPDILRGLFGDIFRNPFFVHMKLSEVVFALDFLDNPGRLRASLEFLGLFEQVRDLYQTVVRDEHDDHHLLYCSA